MREYLLTGKKGEDLAEAYIRDLGFDILERNWRHRRVEIDFIASRSGVLHFIEVKTRTSTAFGYPEESVSNKKIRSLIRCGTAFLFQNPGWKNVQYDILSILISEGDSADYLYIQDIDL